MNSYGKKDRHAPIAGGGEINRPTRVVKRRRDKYKARGFFIEHTFFGDHWSIYKYYRDKQTMIRAYRALSRNGDRCHSSYRMRFPGVPLPFWKYGNSGYQRQQSEPDTPASPELLAKITTAIEKNQIVEITYRDYKDNKTKRRIWPQEWVKDDLFTAYCELRAEERHFRVCRIQGCSVVGRV